MNGKTTSKPDQVAEEPADETQQVIDAVLDYEQQQRLWVKALIPLLETRSHQSDPSDRVQFAFDMMHVAACERLIRILNHDRETFSENG
jgi:hypothetical protein